MRKSQFSAKQRADIVLAFLAGRRKPAEICREYQITPTTLYRWREDFLDGGVRSLEGEGASDREAALEREVEKLKQLVGDISLANYVLKGGRPPSTGSGGGRA